MQFQVPQFIEVEDKIFGPLTFKQFVYCAGGLGSAYIFWRVLPIYIGAPFIAATLGLAASLAFFQFNGRPFIQALENAFFFMVRSKLYLWNNAKKTEKPVPIIGKLVKGTGEVYVPTLSESKLHEMAWSLDIKERIASGLSNDPESHIFRTNQDIIAIHTAREARIE